MGKQAATDAELCAQLENEFPGWHIWRSQTAGVPASWMATLIDPGVGVDPTVMAPTYSALKAELADQLERAQARDPLWAR